MNYQSPKDLPDSIKSDRSSYINAEPAFVNLKELLITLYGRYIDHYNQNPVSGQSELITILNNLDRIQKYKAQELKKDVNRFKNVVDDYYLNTTKEKEEIHKTPHIESFKSFQEKAEELFSLIDRWFDPQNKKWFGQKYKSQELYEEVVYILKQLHEACYKNPYKGQCSDEILAVFRSFAKVRRIGINRTALLNVIDKILESEYSERLETVDEMSPMQKQKIARDIETDEERTLINRIYEFADEYHRESSFSREAIIQYLRNWEKFKGFKQQRSKAQRETAEDFTEMKGARTGYMEKKWSEFHKARAEK